MAHAEVLRGPDYNQKQTCDLSHGTNENSPTTPNKVKKKKTDPNQMQNKTKNAQTAQKYDVAGSVLVRGSLGRPENHSGSQTSQNTSVFLYNLRAPEFRLVSVALNKNKIYCPGGLNFGSQKKVRPPVQRQRRSE